jgi:hypothetical protein
MSQAAFVVKDSSERYDAAGAGAPTPRRATDQGSACWTETCPVMRVNEDTCERLEAMKCMMMHVLRGCNPKTPL